jgi:hypothetical protein
MIGIAANLDGATVLDGDEHRARVRAIVRARRAHDASSRGLVAVERHRTIVRDRRCREAAASVRPFAAREPWFRRPRRVSTMLREARGA